MRNNVVSYEKNYSVRLSAFELPGKAVLFRAFQ
jgi:hypothetical protein